MTVLMALCAVAQVKPGIEVLRDGGFEQLKGKRVGLLTNPTGVDNKLKSTVDILHEAADVELVALYAPEHGVRGDVYAGDKVDNSVDFATGVKVYSLYGKNRRPSAEMLKDIDVFSEIEGRELTDKLRDDLRLCHEVTSLGSFKSAFNYIDRL